MTQDQQAPNNTPETTKKILVITDADALVLEKKLRLGTQVCNLSYLALLVALSINSLLGDKFNLVHWLIAVVPLLIFIPGLIKPQHRTYSWLCFVLLMYFLFLVPLLMSYWSLIYWVLTLLVTVLFAAAMMTSRWLQYWNYYLSSKQ
ncbi:DUF2069 domain-containing protein [Cellvibrio fontiphilus]|jgi:uncharacterized membrane protein|uniref:DUF2069 domain-containing protein n=1 Tax=Cellvibrio fontiphilus TaxID=1815559 RepID=A0ABV7FG62_9GAMM